MPVLPPETTLRFTVLGELAMGGMGRVDLARVAPGGGALSGRLVALKRLHPHMARDPHFVDMFLDEVWITGSLRHPNVVELVAWGRDAEGVFLAMEFVAGASLQHVGRRGRAAGEPMPPELVAHVGAEIAAGLGAAHALTGPDGAPLGVVHRDVTPSNVLVGFDGAVKLTDFGVASAAGKSSHTSTGILKGKVAYMAPEYARVRRFDHRADLYALGVVLYELASGRRPFTAPHDLEMLRLVTEAEPAPIDDVDPALRAIVFRLLAKDPAARPANADALRAELDALAAARGLDRAAAARALSAYVARHAGDRREHVAALAGGDLPEPTSGVVAMKAARALDAGSGTPSATSARGAADPTGMDAFADSVVGAAHTRPDVAPSKLSGGRLVAVAAATFLGVVAALALVIAVGRHAAPAEPSEGSTRAAVVPRAAEKPVATASAPASAAPDESPSAPRDAPAASASAEPVASAEPAPSTEPVASAPTPSASAPSDVPSGEPAASVGASTAPTPERPPSSAAPSATPAPSAHPSAHHPPRPKRSCTPTDFDYPACLTTK